MYMIENGTFHNNIPLSIIYQITNAIDDSIGDDQRHRLLRIQGKMESCPY